jgi:selenocysteine lyase/cysteine desulfurase
MLEHVRRLERAFLAALDAGSSPVTSSDLVVPDPAQRGRFLAFRTDKASAISEALAARNVIVDHRGDRLRVGFGIYHDEADALRLAEEWAAIAQ